MNGPYYFDHAASAPRRDEVTLAMAPWQRGVVGNPTGSHRAARDARRAIEEARDDVADSVGAQPGGVIFTGGGTESCHLAIVGVANRHRRTHASTSIVVSRIEHHAILDAARAMARDCSSVTVRYVDVGRDGVVDLESLRAAVATDTAVVSVMTVNNETGVVQPIDDVARIARAASNGASVVHTDAIAAAPWLDLPTATGAVDMVSVCAHKLGGPVNAGALVVRGDRSLDAVVPGGGQEQGHRGGTVDVAAAVGLAAALRATVRDRAHVNPRVVALQAKLIDGVSKLTGAEVTAVASPRVAGTVHVTFDGLASDELLFLLDQAGVYASAAASCSSGASASSHVLEAMGVAADRARGSLRLSMGRETSESDVDAVLGILADSVRRLR